MSRNNLLPTLVIGSIAWSALACAEIAPGDTQTSEIRVPVSENALEIPIGIETHGGIFTPIFEVGSIVPQEKAETYTTVADNQQAVDVRILQGFRPMAKYNRVLAEIAITDIRPAPRGVPQIKVVFHVSAEGVLSVTAEEVATGQTPEIVVRSATELTPEEILKMQQEAERFREQDAQESSLLISQYQAELMVYISQQLALDAPITDNDRAILTEKIRALESVRTSADEQAITASMDELQQEIERIVGRTYDRKRGIFIQE
jgi:molecular chaperone DnaK